MSPELKSILEALAYLLGAALLFVIRQRSQREIDATKEKVSADLSAHKEAVVAQAQAQTATLESRLAETFTQQLQDTERALSAKVEELGLENAELNRRLDRVTSELTHERERSRQLEDALHQRKEEIALLQKQVGALEDVIKEMREQRDRSIEALGTALGREKSMQSRIETLERELGELKIKNIQLEAELRAYKPIVEPFFTLVAGAFRPPTQPADPMPLPEAA